MALSGSSFGAGPGPILLDDLKCTGRETSILQCRNKGWYTNNCDHTEDVGVVCNSSKYGRLDFLFCGEDVGVVCNSSKYGCLDFLFCGEDVSVVCNSSKYGHLDFLFCGEDVSVVCNSRKYGRLDFLFCGGDGGREGVECNLAHTK